MRCFIALDLLPAPGPAMEDWLDALRGHADLSVPPPENLHLTLAFLGELDPVGASHATEALAATARLHGPWDVEWGEAGAFPSLARPRVLWLGIVDDGPTAVVGKGLRHELAARDLPVDDRPLRPHLTVARVRSAARGPIAGSAMALLDEPPPLAPSRVTGLVLYESRLGRGPATYVRLAEAAFHAQGPSGA
ncbi:MAG: RNA 2',3'-cyclic phosphodiesterase [Candidatus Dormibacteria bacterium]